MSTTKRERRGALAPLPPPDAQAGADAVCEWLQMQPDALIWPVRFWTEASVIAAQRAALAFHDARRAPMPASPPVPVAEAERARKLDGGEKHLLCLIDEAQERHGGWAKVSPQVYPQVMKLPGALVEHELTEGGWARARLTARGAAILDAMAWL